MVNDIFCNHDTLTHYIGSNIFYLQLKKNKEKIYTNFFCLQNWIQMWLQHKKKDFRFLSNCNKLKSAIKKMICVQKVNSL